MSLSSSSGDVSSTLNFTEILVLISWISHLGIFGFLKGFFRLGALYYNATLEAQQPPSEEQRWTRSDYASERFLAVAVSENFGEEGTREIYHNFFGGPPFF